MSLDHAVADTLTLLRRDLRHGIRNPAMTLSGILVPVLVMLLFAGVLGGALSSGTEALTGGADYLAYLTPGIVLMAVGSGVATTAVGVSLDKGDGLHSRLRTMAVGAGPVLAGRSLGSVLRTLISALLVLAVAVAIGYRPQGGVVGAVGAVVLLVVVTVATTWLGMGIGLLAASPQTANALSLPAQFLPFVSSAFVPTATMSPGVQWFATHQPYTPLIETLRSLLDSGTPGDRWPAALAWCLAIGVCSVLWAVRLYARDPSPRTGSVGTLLSSS